MMDKLVLRSAEKADQPAIKALIHEGGINPFGIHWQNFIVAVDANGQLIGCGQLKPHRHTVELASIAVTPHAQGQGIARQIIEQLLTRAPNPTWLMCQAPLTTFYTKFGFVEVSERSQMPAYFRLLHWGVGIFGRISASQQLAIMVWRT